MTPETLAHVHQAAFASERGWQADEFETLCASPYVRLFTREHGFALVRTLANETELLTLAVDPAWQRRGIANALVSEWIQSVQATVAFLEVAQDNTGARTLYAKHGFGVTGRRKGYYKRPGAADVDALLMQSALTLGQRDKSPT